MSPSRPSLALMLLLAPICGCRPPAVEGVQPHALRVQPDALDFGDVFVGARPQLALTVTNPSRAPAQAEVNVAAPFSVTPAALSLGGGDAVLVSVGFSPTSEGPVEATLALGDPASRLEVRVRGVGKAPLACPAGACEASAFDPDRGQCLTAPLADGTSCTAPCFSRAECSAGVCVGQSSTCDDGDPCTVDACGAQGCVHPAVECPVTSACTIGFCAPDAGCQQRAVDDGVSCGPSDCASASICLNGQCQRRARPGAALDCVYDDLHSSEVDVCVLTRGGEVRCWGATGPRFVNPPRKVPAPAGLRFIPNQGGPMYGVDRSGLPWRYEPPGLFRRVPSDAGQYPAPVTMSAFADPSTEWLLVGDSLGWSRDLRLVLSDAGLRAIAPDRVGSLLLLVDGGVSRLAAGDEPDFGEPLERLEAAGSLAVCGHTSTAVRCISRGPVAWAEALRADAGALVGGVGQQACLGSTRGLVSCGSPWAPADQVSFPAGLTRLTRNHNSALCGLTSAGEVHCHAPAERLWPSASGLGDVSTLPLAPVEVPLSEPAVAIALSGRASFAATASGIWAWGGHGDGGDAGRAAPRLVIAAQGVQRLMVYQPFNQNADVIAWLDQRGRLFAGARPALEPVSMLFGCTPSAGAREEPCGVTADGGWFWSSWWMEPTALNAPFIASAGATFLVSDGGVVINALPTDLSSTTPVQLPLAARFVAEDCAVLVDGRVFCGLSRQGARQVTGLLPARQVFGSFDEGCALVGMNGVQCWGSNRFGRLANDTGGSATPVFVAMPEPVVQLVGSGGHTCALLRSGKVRCWGDNSFGQLGLEPLHATPGPLRVTQ